MASILSLFTVGVCLVALTQGNVVGPRAFPINTVHGASPVGRHERPGGETPSYSPGGGQTDDSRPGERHQTSPISRPERPGGDEPGQRPGRDHPTSPVGNQERPGGQTDGSRPGERHPTSPVGKTERPGGDEPGQRPGRDHPTSPVGNPERPGGQTVDSRPGQSHPSSPISRTERPGARVSGQVEMPGIRPETEGPVPPFGQYGDRCPFPPDTNGHYPYYCIQFIGDDCECIYDDIHISQESCLINNRTEYKELAKHQLDLERERDEKRVELGHNSVAEPYFHVLDCLDKARGILERYDNEEGEEEEEEEEEMEEEHLAVS